MLEYALRTLYKSICHGISCWILQYILNLFIPKNAGKLDKKKCGRISFELDTGEWTHTGFHGANPQQGTLCPLYRVKLHHCVHYKIGHIMINISLFRGLRYKRLEPSQFRNKTKISSGLVPYSYIFYTQFFLIFSSCFFSPTFDAIYDDPMRCPVIGQTP